MTWQHCSRTMAIAVFSAIALGLVSRAKAENNLISPDQAEALVRAQIEEQKAAAAAQREEEEAIAAEEAQAGKVAEKKDKGAVATAKASAGARGASANASVEKAASLPVALPRLSRGAQADTAKARALKPLIAQYASENGLPYELADAVVRLESRYNAGARNGPNVGLTQVNISTAKSLGYKGDVGGLLDAETNLRYGLKYLAQAYRLAGGDTCGTILRYQFGLRTTTMTGASRAYCAKVKVLTASAE